MVPSDHNLFDLVQRRTFLWFWERADPLSGMIRIELPRHQAL